VHRQVQERIGASAFDAVVGGERGLLVAQLGVVLRMLGDLQRRQRFDRRHLRRVAALAPRVAEESPHVVLGRLEHGTIVASPQRSVPAG